MQILSADLYAHSLYGKQRYCVVHAISYPVSRLTRRKLLFAEAILMTC